MSIYTKKGDKGETSLFSVDASQKNRVLKSSVKINAIGSVDELDSYMGVIISQSEDAKLNEILKDIQRDLLTAGSILAGSNLQFSGYKTKKLEKMIDEMDASLPPLKNFLLPVGSRVAASLHYARSLTRRAERAINALKEEEKVKPQILKYINRLSDFFFMLARKVNFDRGISDEIWVGKKNIKK